MHMIMLVLDDPSLLDELLDAWQAVGITGATISSQAIANILADSGARWLPVIRADIDWLVAGGRGR